MQNRKCFIERGNRLEIFEECFKNLIDRLGRTYHLKVVALEHVNYENDMLFLRRFQISTIARLDQPILKLVLAP